MTFQKIEHPKAPSANDLELARHIGRELANAQPGTERHTLLSAMFKLMNAKALQAAHSAYDETLCAH